jgi:aspartokinase/homoserine dehydrogenase 1
MHKTIIPLLEKNIHFRVLNTFNHENKGTLITSNSNKEGLKHFRYLKMCLSESGRKRD